MHPGSVWIIAPPEHIPFEISVTDISSESMECSLISYEAHCLWLYVKYMIKFIKSYGPLLNIKYRPCLFHESEGGGVTDEDLEIEDKEQLEFISTDCITTKEVLLRLFHAKEQMEISFHHGIATKNITLIQEMFNKYSFCIIYIFHGIIADARHYLAIARIEGKVYLIQSYLDRYSYDIQEHNNSDDLLEKICIMFDTDNTHIAKSILGDVQPTFTEYRNKQNEILKFTFYSIHVDPSITLEKAISLVNNPI